MIASAVRWCVRILPAVLLACTLALPAPRVRATSMASGSAVGQADHASGSAASAQLSNPAQGCGTTAPAARVVTLAPHVTELVFAAGAGDQVVGTVQASDYPPAAKKIARVGDGLQLNAETILALQPTLVVGWLPNGASQALQSRLAAAGIPWLYAHPETLEDIPRLIRQLGERLCVQDTANQQAQSLEARIQELSAVRPADSGQVPRVLLEISAQPLIVLGRDPLINDLVTRCGAHNLYADQALPSLQPSLESILQAQPDAIILSPSSEAAQARRQAWWSDLGVQAAQAGRVYAVPPDWLHRPGPRLIDAAEALCNDLQQAKDRQMDYSSKR